LTKGNTMTNPIGFIVNGAAVQVADDGASLLEVLRDRLGLRGAKDGCSPQGQCGCCTVLVDGQPRVACVTPASRVRGRSITTIEALPEADAWANALCATGGSQCGFCTPGIIMRLAVRPADPKQALLAHLCRCTGWQTILEAADLMYGDDPTGDRAPEAGSLEVVASNPLAPANATAFAFAEHASDLAASTTGAIGASETGRSGAVNRPGAAERASIEGRTPQAVGAFVALGQGGFADDTSPTNALIAVTAADGTWVVGDTLTDARRRAGKVQGRRTTAPVLWPIEVPAGNWVRTLQTTWVEPAYVEPDATWCLPGGEPVSSLANGGAFGGKHHGAALAIELGVVARRLADEAGQAVKVILSREDVVRLGPKRPPIAAGIRADGTGVIRVAATPGVAAAIQAFGAGFEVEEVSIPGLATSIDIRAAGWAEAAILLASLAASSDGSTIASPDGAWATASIAADGSIHVSVDAGEPLDEIVLRSYCIGAAHQALSWVRSEAIVTNEAGEPQDLTIRSFGILRAIDMPAVTVTVEGSNGPPVNGSDAVFAAVAAAAWRASGFAPRWPTSR
jgi:xanthine dehydrogenase small subunit